MIIAKLKRSGSWKYAQLQGKYNYLGCSVLGVTKSFKTIREVKAALESFLGAGSFKLVK